MPQQLSSKRFLSNFSKSGQIPPAHTAAPHHCDIAHKGQEADTDTTGVPCVETNGDAEPGTGYGNSSSESECRIRMGGDLMCDSRWQKQQREHKQRAYCQGRFTNSHR